MKKAIFAVLCVALLITVFSCGDDGPSVTTYTGNDAEREYSLTVTGGDYELKIDGDPISTGSVSKDGNVFTLTPNGLTPNVEAGPTFTVTVEGKKITAINGVITPDDGGTPITPGDILPPFMSVAGNWEWSTSDDSTTNEWKGAKQSVFEPGGSSRITNAVEEGEGTVPYEYPAGTVTDNDGNIINEKVFNFTGNTKVSRDNRPANEAARFPQVGWEAVPDEETLELLKTAYGYSFWVRLNSSTAGKWAFLTSVVTDFEKDEGHEYKHWFGNMPGDSGGNSKIKNYTGSLQVGTWYKITVIMDKDNGFNMFQDAWIYKYESGASFRGDFNQSAASKIQWQIPLQHQKTGTSEAERNGEPYDVIKGSYDFNLDFYGLELLVE